jgi:hypothetical protein
MSFAGDTLLTALALPEAARVDQRVPKKLLLDHGAPTAADRRLVQDGLDELRWPAVLKPGTVGIPAFRDETREYGEIAVLAAALRPGANATRLVELIHRAVPYPVVLILEQGDWCALSLAHKRRSQAKADAFVADGIESTGPLDGAAPTPVEAAFLADLAPGARPAAHLLDAYQHWIDAVVALAAARVSGRYVKMDDHQRSAARRAALDEHARIAREIATLRARARIETQLARRVDLNLELRRLTLRLDELTATL